MKLLCIGDTMLDVVAILDSEINYASDTRARISTHGGGAAANVASWLAATGNQPFLVTRVGDDAAGKSVLSELDRLGVSHSSTAVPNMHTGVVIVLVDKSGERTMFPDWGANSGLSPADLPPLADFSAIYLSGYPLINPKSRPGVLEIIQIAKSRSLPIYFDPASVGVLSEVGVDVVRGWLTFMSGVLLNEEEAHFLTGLANPVEAANDLLKLSPLVIIKKGANGALGQITGHKAIQFPALATGMVDTTGAGDAFAAGFLPTWLASQNLEAAMLAGISQASKCVSVIGARPLVATR